MVARARLGRFVRDRRGVAAMEFAITGILVVTLMLAAFDMGNAAQIEIGLLQAVDAGGIYAGNAPQDVTGIENAVAAALPRGITLNNPGGVATIACTCGGVTGPIDCAAPPSTCLPPEDVVISVGTNFQPISTGLTGFAPALSASYDVRVQ